jgi:hypothetical protein
VETNGDLDARLRAALAASRELGADYDTAMVDSIRRLVVEHERAPGAAVAPPAPARASRMQVTGPRPRRFGGHGFAGFSLVAAIPLSGIAGGIGHVTGLVVCWGGIVLVNVVDHFAARHDQNH